MARNQSKDTGTETVVNFAAPGSVVGIQCGGTISGSTVVVNGSVVVNGGGRWLDDPADMDRSLIDDLDD